MVDRFVDSGHDGRDVHWQLERLSLFMSPVL